MTTKYAVREDATPGFIQTLKTFPSTVIALLFFYFGYSLQLFYGMAVYDGDNDP